MLINAPRSSLNLLNLHLGLSRVGGLRTAAGRMMHHKKGYLSLTGPIGPGLRLPENVAGLRGCASVGKGAQGGAGSRRLTRLPDWRHLQCQVLAASQRPRAQIPRPPRIKSRGDGCMIRGELPGFEGLFPPSSWHGRPRTGHGQYIESLTVDFCRLKTR